MKGLILFIISLWLLYILAPIGFFFAMLCSGRGRYLYRLAYSIDQTGNVICGKLFDAILIHQSGFKFGEPDHTISAVLGVNEQQGTLTGLGWTICTILDWIDPDHCLKAAKDEGLL